MPLYEYQCSKCGNKEERLRNSDDDQPYFCLNCGSIADGPTMQRIPSAIGNFTIEKSKVYL